MDDKLISKKDLLTKEGISYGTLYRWKRQGLIPESWFIHKATEIGQATFFPEEKITSEICELLFERDYEKIAETVNAYRLAHGYKPKRNRVKRRRRRRKT